MKRTRFSEQRMVRILREADQAPVAERDLDMEILKEERCKNMVSAPVRRQQIACVCQRDRSVQRASALLSVDGPDVQTLISVKGRA